MTELIGDELQLGLDGGPIFVVPSAPVPELLQVVCFPLRYAAVKFEAVEQPFRLLGCPAIVEKCHR